MRGISPISPNNWVQLCNITEKAFMNETYNPKRSSVLTYPSQQASVFQTGNIMYRTGYIITKCLSYKTWSHKTPLVTKRLCNIGICDAQRNRNPIPALVGCLPYPNLWIPWARRTLWCLTGLIQGKIRLGPTGLVEFCWVWLTVSRIGLNAQPIHGLVVLLCLIDHIKGLG